MNQFGELGFSVWDIEFGDHATASERESNALLISGYFEANIGQLNTLINTDFYLDNTEDKVVPSLFAEEKAIFTQLYLKDYMNKQARNILRNAASGSSSTNNTVTTVEGVTDWIELREGDTSIKRSVATSTSKNASAQIFQKSASEANELLKQLVHSYNMYGSAPLQVAGIDASINTNTLETQISKLNESIENLSESVVSQNQDIEEALDVIRDQIIATAIEGFTKSYPLQKGKDSITVNWSSEFTPSKIPTVIAVIRSSNTEDSIVSYRIDGNISLQGCTFVFTDKIISNEYSLELAAFVVD